MENLSTQARKILNKYHRDWAKKNPDKVRKINLRYWEKKVHEADEKDSSNESRKNSLDN